MQRPAGGADFPRELSRRRHADVRDQLLAPGGQIIAQYYNFLRLGHAGYRRDPPGLLRHRPVALHRDRQAGAVRVHLRRRPGQQHPGVCCESAGGGPRYTLYDLSDQLTRRGWQVPAFPLPGGVRHGRSADHDPPGVSRDMAACCSTTSAGGGPLRQAPGHRAHVEGGVKRVQPPVARACTCLAARSRNTARDPQRLRELPPACLAAHVLGESTRSPAGTPSAVAIWNSRWTEVPVWADDGGGGGSIRMDRRGERPVRPSGKDLLG